MNKKLALLLWDFSLGGLQNRMRQLLTADQILKDDFEIFLILFEKKNPEKKIPQRKNLKIVYFPGYDNSYLWSFISQLPFGKFILRTYWLTKIIKNGSLTHVLSYSNQLSLVATFSIVFLNFFRRKNVKFIIAEAIVLSTHIKIKQKWFWWYLSRIPYKFASKVIVATNVEKRDLIKNFSVNKGKIKIIRNWIKI